MLPTRVLLKYYAGFTTDDSTRRGLLPTAPDTVHLQSPPHGCLRPAFNNMAYNSSVHPQVLSNFIGFIKSDVIFVNMQQNPWRNNNFDRFRIGNAEIHDMTWHDTDLSTNSITFSLYYYDKKRYLGERKKNLPSRPSAHFTSCTFCLLMVGVQRFLAVCWGGDAPQLHWGVSNCLSWTEFDDLRYWVWREYSHCLVQQGEPGRHADAW